MNALQEVRVPTHLYGDSGGPWFWNNKALGLTHGFLTEPVGGAYRDVLAPVTALNTAYVNVYTG